MASGAFPSSSLPRLDCAAEAERICRWMVEALASRLHRRGFVVALSGGVDSSVCAALAVRAVGAGKVYGLLLPERDSSTFSTERALRLVRQLGIAHEVFDIGPALEALGCYERRDAAIRRLLPSYGAGWRNKIVIAGGLEGGINYFKLVVGSPDRVRHEVRLPAREYLEIVAATNFKQRARKMIEYYHADRLNYVVTGTPNLLEYDQGFFVKLGDGAADLKPIAHLYKTQVYALAKALEIPKEISSRPPSTDTYSLPQTQEEFYFSLPYDQMDLCLYARDHQLAAADVAAALGRTPEQIERVFRDIDAKRKMARYLHSPPLLIDSQS